MNTTARPRYPGSICRYAGDGRGDGHAGGRRHGYLYWGEENQGPIDWWTVDGGALQIQAGVAVIDGTIDDGIMTVELDDGFWTLFALPGADTSGIAPVSIDDYFALLYGVETDGA